MSESSLEWRVRRLGRDFGRRCFVAMVGLLDEFRSNDNVGLGFNWTLVT